MLSFKEFSKITKILVEVPGQILNESIDKIEEATKKTVGNYVARRDPPHFQGDEYHAHATISSGYEVGWGISGTRRHPNKFPLHIPNDAKQAIADVLGVDVSILEGYIIHDNTLDEDMFLIEVKDT